jgi:hypothetical protein
MDIVGWVWERKNKVFKERKIISDTDFALTLSKFLSLIVLHFVICKVVIVILTTYCAVLQRLSKFLYRKHLVQRLTLLFEFTGYYNYILRNYILFVSES